MARPSPRLVEALTEAARRLEGGARYAWGHFGRCNCGHLAQVLTRRSAAEIHALALARAGDWGEQALEVCPATRLPLDAVIDEMLAAGLEREDLVRLERLSDRRVLARVEGGRALVPNRREDAARYLRAFAALLADELAASDGAGAGRQDRAPRARRTALQNA